MKISLENLSKFLNVPPNQLGAMIFNTELFYKELIIPKRRGGIRKLNVPNNILRSAQKIIYRDILGNFQAHEAAQAYVRKKSIVTNANKHINSPFMLKLDIENFFGRISEKLVTDKFIQLSEVFSRQGFISENTNFSSFTDVECKSLASICTLNGGLPQGAITSPHLSNLIFYKIDEAIKIHCDKIGVKYTRYSDDMIFTAMNDSVFEVEDFVRNEISNIGLLINESKTLRLNDRQNKYVTGLFIQNGKLRLAKNRRREIRQEYHKYFLIKSNIKEQSFKAIDKTSLLGKLAFWRFIEPDCDFPKKAISTIKEN